MKGASLRSRAVIGAAAAGIIAIAAAGFLLLSGGDDDAAVINDAVDSRPFLLAELGGPDAFRISWDEFDGEIVRSESWTWFDAATQIDLIDGEVLWSIAIEPLPDGALLPIAYAPSEFKVLQSSAQVRELLTGVELEEIEASDELETEGAFLLAGEQILLAFIDDQLVYVETFPLISGEAEVVE